MSTLLSQGSSGMCLPKQSMTLALSDCRTPALLRGGVKYQNYNFTFQSLLGNPGNLELVPRPPLPSSFD